jgi:hypothetical protein
VQKLEGIAKQVDRDSCMEETPGMDAFPGGSAIES